MAKKQKTIELGEIYKCFFPKRYYEKGGEDSWPYGTLLKIEPGDLIVPKDIFSKRHGYNDLSVEVILECYNLTTNKLIYIDMGILNNIENYSKENLSETTWQNFNICCKKI